MSIQSVLASRVTKAVAFAACLIPLAILRYRWGHQLLGANWIEAAQQWTGDWTLRFLIFTLCITPLRKITKINALMRYRRMLGLYAFFYGTVHFSIYLVYDKAFDWTDIRGDFHAPVLHCRTARLDTADSSGAHLDDGVDPPSGRTPLGEDPHVDLCERAARCDPLFVAG